MKTPATCVRNGPCVIVPESAKRVFNSSPGVHGILVGIQAEMQRLGATKDILSLLDSARLPLWRYLSEHLGSSIAAKALSLKILNLLLAKHHFAMRSAMLISRPFGLLVDPSNGCNLSCPGCVHSSRAKSLQLFDWNKGMLSEERYSELLKRYGTYAVQIMFCNYGEPTANLKTPRFIEIAKSYFSQTALSTNLTIGRFDAEAYVQSGLDFLYLSIDGVSQAIYEKFRRNGNIDIVFRNIRNLVEAKRRLGKRTPVIRWQFLAFEHNANEIPLALETARTLGLDQFAVETPFDVSWDDRDVRPASDVRPFSVEISSDTECTLRQNWASGLSGMAAETIEREFSTEWASVLSDDDLAAAGHAEPPVVSEHTCNWLYKNMVMDANGRVLPCCSAPKAGFNLDFGMFTDAGCNSFNSELYQRARLHFAETKALPAGGTGSGAVPDPHCTHCDWDQTHTEIGAPEVAQYLRSVGIGVMDPDSIRMLCDW